MNQPIRNITVTCPSDKATSKEIEAYMTTAKSVFNEIESRPVVVVVWADDSSLVTID